MFKQFKLFNFLIKKVYFLRRDLVLKKYMSPLLRTLKINYDEEIPASDEAGLLDTGTNNGFDSSQIDENSRMMDDDDDDSDESQQSMNVGSPMSISSSLNRANRASFIASQPESANLIKVITQKKVRIKRAKKSGYNIFSRDFRKKLRDSKSSLAFHEMSREVGDQWRMLTQAQRQEYERLGKIETLKNLALEKAAKEAEEAELAKRREEENHHQQIYPQQQIIIQQHPQHHQQQQQQNHHPNHINNILASNQVSQWTINTNNGHLNGNSYQNGQQKPIIIYQHQQQLQQPQQHLQQVPSPQQQHHHHQQQQQQQQPIVDNTPKQVQHRDAYLKYIADIRANQNGTLTQTSSHADWYRSLDVNYHISEKNIKPPPSCWIENCTSNNILEHLMSLRYHMLDDAVNIQKYSTESAQSVNIEPSYGNEEPVYAVLN
jgi:hypothetical protein